MGIICINKSSVKQKVVASMGSSTATGYIYPNEVFAFKSRFAGSHAYSPSVVDYVCIRASGGGVKHGVIIHNVSNLETPITNYSFGNVTASGSTFKSLKTRAALPFYNASAVKKGTCANGARILTTASTCGQTMPYLLWAKYYESGVATNRWALISGTTAYGFIQTGLGTVGSMKNTVGIYGNW